jgi:aminopeptidase N
MNRLRQQVVSLVLIAFLFTPALTPIIFAQSAGQTGDLKCISVLDLRQGKNSTSRSYDVLHYNLDLSVKPDPFYVQGNITIQIVLLAGNLDQVEFDLQGLQVESVLYNGLPVNFTLADGALILTSLTTIMAGDTGTCTIFYQGTPQSGLYRRQNFAGDTIIYSHNEPYEARFWFPCNDDPGDKATHIVSIRMPVSYTVLSNGRKIAEYLDSPGWMRTVWEEDYPIATYLISLAAAPYHIVEQNWSFETVRMPLDYYVYPADASRALNALTTTTQMLSFFSGYIGLYPFSGDKYAMAEVPLVEAAAMENQTATTMRDAVMDNEEIIAHELAHQWWGDALTPASFADIWLNEGFASYFDVLYTEYSAGEYNYKRRMENYKGLLFQDGSLSYPVYNPPAEYLFGRSVYYKGAWILHMLRSELGEELFKSICQTYYQQYKYSNVTTTDFIQTCEEVGHTSLDTFFNQWLYYGGLPNLYLSWHQDGPLLSFIIQQLQTETVYDLKLEIHIQGFSRDSLLVVSCNRPVTEYQVSFSDPVQMVTLDPEDKVLQVNNTPVYYLARHTALLKIYPHPVHKKAQILYQVDRAQQIRIEIWNILGERVAILKNEKQPGGLYHYIWDPVNLSSGTYLCILRAGDQVDVKKIVILK